MSHKHATYGTWKCHKCNLIFETRKQLKIHNHEFHPVLKGHSWNYGLTKETDSRIQNYIQTCKVRNHYISPFAGSHLSQEQKDKTSVSMKKFLAENPDKVPYLLNHSSKESYPEKYFREVFVNEAFPRFIQDKYVKGYFLDFAFDDYKCFIEIDGEQHYVDQKIIKHDIIRYEVLSKTEWKCIARIRWSKFKKLTKDQQHNLVIRLKQKILNN